jgi:acyl-CoA thioesterase-1
MHSCGRKPMTCPAMIRSGLALCALAVFAAACDSSGPPSDRHSPAPVQTSKALELQVASARPRIVVLGDSLTAGLGLSPTEAYPALLQARVDAAGLDYEVVNAGVSGDTSAGGLRRLDWALEGHVRFLIVALGGNDALRGLPAEELQRNLSAIIERGQKAGAVVILAGMEAPPNFGRSYIVSFHQVYPKLARQYRLPLVPFLLQGVAGVDGLNQRDGIHPTAEGARMVADNVWAVLSPLLGQARHDD